MRWRELKSKIKFFDIYGSAEFEVKGVELDSRKIQPDFIFIAQQGLTTDGHQFISQAITAGAKVIVCEHWPARFVEGIEYVLTGDSADLAGEIANLFYDYPSHKLKLVGVTGTNGKTTTVTLLYRLIQALGYKAGLLSTIKNFIHYENIPATHTTPDVIRINELLNAMVSAGCDFAFMEVSSHAMKQKRVAGLKFTGGVFTNITHDHLDYHGSFKDYLYAKKLFFDQLSAQAFAIINKDDRNGMVMVQNTKAAIISYSMQQMADIKGKIIANTLQGLVLQVNDVEVHFRLIGLFNAYNILACYGTSLSLGFNGMEVLTAMSQLPAVDGRFDTFYHPVRKVLGIVDYAHTPDALSNVLETIKALKMPAARVFTVVGCGGDRDRTKRPIMAEIAMRQSDWVVFTSDNPRTEDPELILDEMIAGLEAKDHPRMLRITDRRQAIKMAAQLANIPGDIILIAGKGHETYQEISGKRFPFDDKSILKEVLI